MGFFIITANAVDRSVFVQCKLNLVAFTALSICEVCCLN